jgi:hypothetical protein
LSRPDEAWKPQAVPPIALSQYNPLNSNNTFFATPILLHDHTNIIMADYNSLKVPDLKKILTERALPLSGNKADLIARLQEDDKKKAPVSAGMPSPRAILPLFLPRLLKLRTR